MDHPLFNKQQPKESMEKDITQEVPNTKPNGGSKLSTIFLVVLGLHIIIIIAVSGFHLLRGNTAEKDSVAANATVTEEQNVAPTGTPIVQTEQSNGAIVSEPETATATTAAPASNDPVWSSPATASSALSTSTSEATGPVATSIPVSESGKTYTVVKGDTLTRIAKKTGTTIQQLHDTNKMTTDALKIGQKMNLPAGTQVVQQTAPAKAPTPSVASTSSAPQSGYTTYKVAKGDTLTKIAKAHRTSVANLSKINGIQDPTKLRIGMEIKVPSQTASNINTSVNTQKPAPANIENTDLAMLHQEKQ